MSDDRAVLLVAPGEPPRVEPVRLDPPGPGEVRVRVAAVGVCHSDLHVLETAGWGMRFPIALGHEAAGFVEDVGEGVRRVAPGDYVVLGWRAPCGSCPECERGDRRRCRAPLRARRRTARAADGSAVTPTLLVGGFATRTTVHEGQAVRVPEALPPEQACLLGCAVATGVGAVLHTARVREGARVAVVGCGGVGLSVVQGARIAGAAEVWAADLDAGKREWALRLGATEAVEALPDELRVDYAFDAVGVPATFEACVRALDRNGVATLIGLPKPGTAARIALEQLFDARAEVRVSHGGDHLPAEDFPLLAEHALSGRLDLASLASRTAGLEDVEAAFDAMRSGDVVRTVLVP